MSTQVVGGSIYFEINSDLSVNVGVKLPFEGQILHVGTQMPKEQFEAIVRRYLELQMGIIDGES